MKKLFICLSLLLYPLHAEDIPSVEQLTEKLQQGEIDLTLEKLKKIIKENPGLSEHRLLTAKVLEYVGKHLYALKTLNEGLNGSENDLQLLRLIAQIHQQLGNDGMFVKTARGSVEYSPNADEKKDTAFKDKHNKLALDYINKALKIKPGDEFFSRKKAESLSTLGKYNEAAEVYENLCTKNPNNLPLKQSLAEIYDKANNAQKASNIYNDILQVDPQFAKAYLFLAKLAIERENFEEAKELKAKAEFYSWLPKFCKVPYSNENLMIYKTLSSGKSKERTDLLEKLNNSTEPEALAFLAALCSLHSDHGAIENRAYETLSKNGNTGAKLLIKLLENANSTCTAKSSIHKLGVLKNEQGFEYALKMLPGDTRAFWHMNIAEALVKFNNEKAVEPLIKAVNVDHVFKKLKEEDNPMSQQEGILSARVRALIALGHFTGQEIKILNVIKRGLKNPQLNIAALAAKYRLTKKLEIKKMLIETLLKNKKSPQSGEVLQAFYYSSDQELKELAESLKDQIK